MIILPEQFEYHKGHLGSKTLNLKKLQDLGLTVPKFAALPTGVVHAVWQEHQHGGSKILMDLAGEITSVLQSPLYIVRSSALLEDTEHSSFAGQFMTLGNLDEISLPAAILSVTEDANLKLGGSLSLFSIIIQEYIVADYAGIAFTRNPKNSRDLVIEYHKGIGEAVVGGAIIPSRVELYWNQEVLRTSSPDFSQVIPNFKRIETSFGQPQDIEWCVNSSGEFFYLQARPITTISPADYQEFLFLDKSLPSDSDFMFEKTEISEIAPRPTPCTLSLLDRIYAEGGPVQNVYKRYGIDFRPKPFFKIIGNELYVDREHEIHTLLPSYSYLGAGDYSPKFAHIHGWWKTLKNIFKLNTMPMRHVRLAERLQECLDESISPQENLEETIAKFLAHYEIVFEINLLAEKAMKQLQSAIRKDSLNIGTLLSMSLGRNNERITMPYSNLLGNSLEISDVTPFIRHEMPVVGTSGAVSPLEWMPKWKQDYLKPFIWQAQLFIRFREYGRWLAVKDINTLRQRVHAIAGKNSFRDKDLIFFFSLNELGQDLIHERVGKERKARYEEFDAFTFPHLLTATVPNRMDEHTLIAVSPGSAEGVLRTADRINGTEKAILYTKLLSPDLVQYFPSIQGIVSEQGGVLSHLAIMAREHHIPVIVNFVLQKSDVRLGDHVAIDADNVSIRRV